jgi:F-type H+-transporting ATPase subunit delta
MNLDKLTAGKKYGKALFELASERNAVDATLAELITLRSVFNEVGDLGAILTDARLAPAQKEAIVNDLLGNSELVDNFVHVLFESGRMNTFVSVIDAFEAHVNSERGIATGKVTTAVPLTDAQRAEIASGVQKKFGLEKIELTEVVYEKIIGGVIVEADQQIIDGSIATQLMKLRQLLGK